MTHKCINCTYCVVSGGFCSAKEKYTVLDAPPCEMYVPKEGEELSRLRAENDELRELVSVMCYCMQEDADCDKCKMNDAEGRFTIGEYFACDGLAARMRELVS